MRKAELLGLAWRDIDLETRVATIERVDDLPDEYGTRTTEGTKNGDAVRKVALSPQALEVLEAMPRSIDPVLREQVLPISYDALSRCAHIC